MIEIEGAVQPGTRLYDSGGAVVVGGNGTFGQEPATDALMVAFAVVVSHVFANKMSQVGFAKNDEVIETLLANGFYETLSVGVTVRALLWDGDAGDAAAGKEQLPVLGEQRIAVVHQEPRAAEKTICWIAKVAKNLNHPCFIGINTNASDVNDARLQLDDEEHQVPDGAESAERSTLKKSQA